MKASILNRIILIIILLTVSSVTMAQEEKVDENLRYVKVDSSSPDAVMQDGTDFFESEPVCMLITNQPVTLTGKRDGEFVQIRAVCRGGKTEVGWIKEIALVKKPMPNVPTVSESGGIDSAPFAQPGTIGYEPIDTTGMRKRTTILNPVGTGRTTGVIAEIPITNTGNTPIPIAPQTVYIRSKNDYQPYIGRIAPGHIVPAGYTVAVPVTGYCIDIDKPPVPAGANLPPIDTWIPVRNPDIPAWRPPSGLPLIPGREAEPFNVSQIPFLTGLPGFEKKKPNTSATAITVWPGTDIPVGGTINPVKNEDEFAPLLVDVVMRIENEAYDMVSNGIVNTPFTGDRKREAEALTQQTVWIVLAGLFGERYTKDDFGDQIVEQFEENTDTRFGAASDEVKESINTGIDQFWMSFHLVGVEAKVFKGNDTGADLSGVKARTNGAAKKASGKSGADAMAPGNEIHIGEGSSKETAAHESPHIAQNQTAAVSTTYDDVNEIDDYKDVGDGGTGRKKYDEYTVERELNGKNHEDACKAVGIKTDSSMGKSFKRVYNKQKSK